MSRYTEKIVIAFDSDEAGKKAALRAIPLLEKTGMSVKLVDMGAFKDPDEFLKKQGSDAFKILLERSENHISYRLLNIMRSYDLSTDDGRLSYISAATSMLSELVNKPEREIYGSRVAKEAGVSTKSVLDEIEKKFRGKTSRQKSDFEKRVKQPADSKQPMGRGNREEHIVSAIAEEGVVRCLVRDPTLLKVADEMKFSSSEFTSPFLRRVYELLIKRISQSRDTKESFIMSEFDSEEASRLTSILEKPEVLPYGEKSMHDYIGKIRAEKFRSVKSDAVVEDMLLEIKKIKESGR